MSVQLNQLGPVLTDKKFQIIYAKQEIMQERHKVSSKQVGMGPVTDQEGMGYVHINSRQGLNSLKAAMIRSNGVKWITCDSKSLAQLREVSLQDENAAYEKAISNCQKKIQEKQDEANELHSRLKVRTMSQCWGLHSVGSENSCLGLRPFFEIFKGTDRVLTELCSERASHRARVIRPQTATRYCSKVSQRAVGRDAESLPRFTCSICDAKSGSDSSSSGKYRSSSELQSIGNTIIQNSTAASLTHSSFTGVLGTTEMTRHTSVGRESALPFSSVSPTLSSDIKSANLLGCLTSSWRLQSPIVPPELASYHLFFHHQGEQKRTLLLSCHRLGGTGNILWSGLASNIVSFVTTLRSTPYSRDLGHSEIWRISRKVRHGTNGSSSLHHLHHCSHLSHHLSHLLIQLRNFSILGFHLSPHLSSDIGECDIFIIKEILLDFICFSFSLRTITSTGGGTSLALASVYSLNRWLSIFIIFTFIIISFIIDVGVPQHVDNFHALASRPVFPFAGTSRRRIPEPVFRTLYTLADRDSGSFFFGGGTGTSGCRSQNDFFSSPEELFLFNHFRSINLFRTGTLTSGSRVDIFDGWTGTNCCWARSSAFSFILCLLVSLPPDEEASVLFFPGIDIPVGRVVVFAVTTETLPPVTTL
ncbi:hypothetical protein M5K25_021231 [Dendrobium thyrsiflorum]|uniref:Uncharacterized protein n=1 Tax=Dendrobium thyrsiflorum TaxID=117978 RepID=A0ABD0UIV0_DENTH